MIAAPAYGPEPVVSWRRGVPARERRNLPAEAPVAFVYDGTAHAVMMATPCDLTDFAVGFSLTEGIVERPEDIAEIETLRHEDGVQLRIWLADGASEAMHARRRRLAGPAGCGLCGIESIAEAVRPARTVTVGARLDAEALRAAMAGLAAEQPMNVATRATHAAAFWHPREGLVALREDVGRHNALDKLVGAIAGRPAAVRDGAVLLTSRVSVEMVQKTAAAGIPAIVAVSAPTALAVRVADAAGVTLVAVARADGFEIFTRPERVVLPLAPAEARA